MKLLIDKQVIEQALEALRDLCDDQREQFDELAYPLRSALESAESVEQEPVAWFYKENGRVYLTTSPEPNENQREVGYGSIPNWQPLYTHPAPYNSRERKQMK